MSFEIPGIAIETPSGVGPFSVFDARANGSQTIFDFSSIRHYQAARASAGVAESEGDSTQDEAIVQVAKAYLAALRAEVQLEPANANVTLAGELLALAQNQKAAGTGTGIDVTRAHVQLQNERQLLLMARNASRRAHLELLRAMDMPLDTEVELTDELTYHPVAMPPLELAENELAQARRRFEAGVASSIEVTDAQNRLARARDNQTNAVFACAVLYLMTTLGMGVFISTVFNTQQQTMMASFFFFNPAFMLSGFAFPIRNMPVAEQYLSYVNPVRYFLEIVRGLFLKGTGFESLWPQMLSMAVFGGLILTFSALRFHKRLD